MIRTPIVCIFTVLTLAACGGGGSSGTQPSAIGNPADLVINEVDYNMPGPDDAEFVEIYNPSALPIPLAGIALVQVNGGNNSEVWRADLSSAGAVLAPGGFLVVGSPNVLGALPAGLPQLALPLGIQNGAPDALALIDTNTLTVIDALSYQGSITAAQINGFAGPVSLVEGTAATAQDNSAAGSLVRQPDGNDTDDADSDWSLSQAPTPGTSN